MNALSSHPSMLRRMLLAAVTLACASLAHADALRLLAPAGGATLRGGSFAEVRWTAAQLPAHAEEWEAFLSVDGGRYYAFRITPHLDIRIQRFSFVVPNVDTRNARILIRTGNERRETLVEVPATFAIARDIKAETTLPRLLHSGREEAAREGDPGVIAWTSGERDGSDVAQQSPVPAPSRGVRNQKREENESAQIVPPSAKRQTPNAVHPTPLVQSSPPATGNAQPATTADLLLICRRRNV